MRMRERFAEIGAWTRASPARLRARRVAAPLSIGLATVCLSLALLTGYASHAVFDSDQFANRALAALEDEDVSEEVATKITDEVVLRADRDLVGLRPVIGDAVQAIVGAGAFQGLFRGAVGDLHRTLFERDAHTVTLTVLDIGVLVRQALTALAPQIADSLRRSGDADVLEAEPPAVPLDLVQAAADVRALELVLIVLAVLLYAVALTASVDRRRTVTQAGAAAALAGVLLLLAWEVGRAILVARIDEPGLADAAGGVWDAFLVDLRNALLILAAAGTIVAAAARSMLRPVGIADPLRSGWRALVTVPERAWLGALRAALLIVAGVLVVANPLTALRLLALAAGLVVIYAGVAELLRLSVSEEQLDARARGRDLRRARRRGRARRVAVAAAPALLVIAVGSLFVGLGGASEPPPELEACNGHAELCDRPLDEIVLPTTHNSMSALTTEPEWLFAGQEKDVGGQLAGGIRGLLIDTHYGIQGPSGKVKTDLGDIDNAERREYVREFGAEAVDAALRIRDSLGDFGAEGERGVFLCHRFCELGATPLPAALRQIRDFMVAHPSEVLVVMNQDEGVTPQDFTAAVEDAGLAEFAYRGPTDPMPTLREMIESHGRVLFLAENRAGAAPWYRSAYTSLVQETPFTFKDARELADPDELRASCRPNRGPASAPLLLLNHWVDTSPTPRPSNAERVNAYRPLLRRARTCRRLRDRLPNLIAVDFFETGDLFAVVDELNGVD